MYTLYATYQLTRYHVIALQYLFLLDKRIYIYCEYFCIKPTNNIILVENQCMKSQ